MNQKSTFLFFVGFSVCLSAQTEIESLRKSLENNQKKIDVQIEKLKSEGQIPPREYNIQDYKRTMDPETGMVFTQNLVKINQELKNGKYAPKVPMSLLPFKSSSTTSKGSINNTQWIERGPYKVGGRTRAILFDPNDATGKKVFAGGVSGGLWVNNDITNAASEWTPIGDFWANTSISCIAADPNNPKIIYVGTGETYTDDAIGSGLWKTTDGGTTWTQIFNPAVNYTLTGRRNGIFYVNDVKVRNNAGVSEVYVGTSGGSVDGTLSGYYNTGLYKSTDGGATFTKNPEFFMTVSGSTGLDVYQSIQQIEIGADNSVWVSTRRSGFTGVNSGGKIYRSTNGTNFTKVYDANRPTSRVQIALSKTDGSKAYALLQADEFDAAGKLINAEPVRIIRTTDTGTTWKGTNDTGTTMTLPNPVDTGIPDNDFTRGQHWYDLVIVADPQNDAEVYVGGIDLYKSTNSADTWKQVSKWSNNNDMKTLQVSGVHADQHAIVFNPKNLSQIAIGNDGGVYFASNKNSLDNTTAIPARNARYNVTQFYTGKLNPVTTDAKEEIILGAQDNGTQMLYGAPLANNFYTETTYYGGDGAFCDYDDKEYYQLNSYVYNAHFIYSVLANSFLQIFDAPDSDLGHFINEAVLDRNLDIFYSYRTRVAVTGNITLNRVKGLASNPLILDKSTIDLGNSTSSDVTFLSVSPYITTATELYVGMSNGALLKVTNADTTPVVTQMVTPFVGSVSDIAFGLNNSEIIVTISNYNTQSVYHTTDGGTTWIGKENNLPDMPVRSALMNPENNNEVIVGTEVGIWGTTNFQSATPTWSQYSKGLPNVRVTDLDYRPSTKTVLGVTYGRGAFTTVNAEALATNDVNHKEYNKVYPNPTRGDIYLKYNSSVYKNVNVTIYDASGKLVYKKANVKADETISHNLPKGIYILKAESDGTNVVTSSVIIR